MTVLRPHRFRLQTPRLVLRPMSEDDWPTLLRWNQDPTVLEYWDSGNTEPWTLTKLQDVYRGISQHAWMFVLETGGVPIGEAWVQEMNLPELLERFPRRPLHRIDISIGEPRWWGHGLGSEAIAELVRFAFGSCGSVGVFACHVSGRNPRSRRAFERLGFREIGPPGPDSPGSTESHSSHLVRWRSSTDDLRPSESRE